MCSIGKRFEPEHVLLGSSTDRKTTRTKIDHPKIIFSVRGKIHKDVVGTQMFWRQTHFQDLGITLSIDRIKGDLMCEKFHSTSLSFSIFMILWMSLDGRFGLYKQWKCNSTNRYVDNPKFKNIRQNPCLLVVYKETDNKKQMVCVRNVII